MSIRFADPDDARAIARVHVVAWRETYDGLMPASVLRDLSVEDRTRIWSRILDGHERQVIVCEAPAEPDGARPDSVIGFINFGRCRDDDLDPSRTAEVFALYLLRAHWNRGHGAALLRAALAELTDRGFESVALWVLDTNVRGRSFYEKGGFALDGATKPLVMGGAPLQEVRYRRKLTPS